MALDPGVLDKTGISNPVFREENAWTRIWGAPSRFEEHLRMHVHR
jgi:hypothetical protein